MFSFTILWYMESLNNQLFDISIIYILPYHILIYTLLYFLFNKGFSSQAFIVYMCERVIQLVAIHSHLSIVV